MQDLLNWLHAEQTDAFVLYATSALDSTNAKELVSSMSGMLPILARELRNRHGDWIVLDIEEDLAMLASIDGEPEEHHYDTVHNLIRSLFWAAHYLRDRKV